MYMDEYTFKHCPKGHYYQGDECPYCKQMADKFKQCLNGHYYKGVECPYCDMLRTQMRICESIQDLYKNINVRWRFDESPDHITRIICLNRSVDGTQLEKQIAGYLDCEVYNIPKDICQKVEALKDSINHELLTRHIAMHSGERFGNYYILGYAKSILPDTLLSQVLGKTSKLDALYDYWGHLPNNEKVKWNTAVSERIGDEQFELAKEKITSQKHIGISIKDNSMAIVDMKQGVDNYEGTNMQYFIKNIRPYHSEDIELYDPIVVIKDSGKIVYEQKFHDEDYVKFLTEWKSIPVLDGYLRVSYRIDRQRIAQILTTLFNRVSNLHDRGIVHCDIKPQNILSLRGGLSLIDSLDVRVNDISVGFTPNYCAPEQILARPVSPATDIYSLGLIILSLVNGVMYGETSEFVIPVGNDKIEKIKLLTKSNIYLDNNQGTLCDNEGMSNWRTFLEKCLAVDTHDRFANMSKFIQEYQRLIECYPLTGYIEFNPDFGNLELMEVDGVKKMIYKLNAC